MGLVVEIAGYLVAWLSRLLIAVGVAGALGPGRFALMQLQAAKT